MTPFRTLTSDDVSYAKLVQLHDRLLSATKAGTATWEWTGGDGFSLISAHGVIDVEPRGVRIYDDSGNRIREFHPGTDGLYCAAKAQHEADAVAVLDRIIVELAAL